VCCSGRWLNTTDSVNTDHSEGTKMERWRNGNVTHSAIRPLVFMSWLGNIILIHVLKEQRKYALFKTTNLSSAFLWILPLYTRFLILFLGDCFFSETNRPTAKSVRHAGSSSQSDTSAEDGRHSFETLRSGWRGRLRDMLPETHSWTECRRQWVTRRC
jgi:hypothetical protein